MRTLAGGTPTTLLPLALEQNGCTAGRPPPPTWRPAAGLAAAQPRPRRAAAKLSAASGLAPAGQDAVRGWAAKPSMRQAGRAALGTLPSEYAVIRRESRAPHRHATTQVPRRAPHPAQPAPLPPGRPAAPGAPRCRRRPPEVCAGAHSCPRPRAGRPPQARAPQSAGRRRGRAAAVAGSPPAPSAQGAPPRPHPQRNFSTVC